MIYSSIGQTSSRRFVTSCEKNAEKRKSKGRKKSRRSFPLVDHELVRSFWWILFEYSWYIPLLRGGTGTVIRRDQLSPCFCIARTNRESSGERIKSHRSVENNVTKASHWSGFRFMLPQYDETKINHHQILQLSIIIFISFCHLLF